MFQHVEDLNRFMLRGKKKKRLILYKNSNRCLPNFIFPSCGIFPLPPLLSIHVIPSPPPLFFLSLIKIFFPWLHEREEARNRERERERDLPTTLGLIFKVAFSFHSGWGGAITPFTCGGARQVLVDCRELFLLLPPDQQRTLNRLPTELRCEIFC